MASALSMRTVMTSEMTCWTSPQRRAQSPLTKKSQRSPTPLLRRTHKTQPHPGRQHAPPHSPRPNGVKLSPRGHPSILGARPSHCHPASDLLNGKSHAHPADPSPPRFWTDSGTPSAGGITRRG
ncbi:hypothetical protein M5D96_012112 [Drosophila gunungcola]|uniref:Uncharacterized protein n=1 Tax=Drosophila gunungcola TaxID=103775 RepID=A0A9P9YDX3_9MUSC|nr:hypothetical protein M5D96_012112 [Drosophila gunungcola]